MRLSRSTVSTMLLAIWGITACRTPAPASSLRDDEADQTAAATYKGPPGGLDVDANHALWSEYCVGEKQNPAVLPTPHYANEEVMRAAGILSQMHSHSFALYSQINRHYKQANAARPEGVTPMAHDFLVYLCGEFRDRAGMVRSKIRWVHNTNYLEVAPQPQVDPSRNPWLQMTAESYRPYLDFSASFFHAKKNALEGKHTFGAISGVDKPVPPQTVCETKFIFSEFIDENKDFPGLETFQAQYQPWAATHCSQDDLDHYYDFRVDGNFKPNSPESNGMIWHGISIALQCENTVNAKTSPYYPGQALLLTDEQCRDYFASPFLSRWAGARAGLGTWMLHDRSYDDHFRSSSREVTVVPNWRVGAVHGPHRFKVGGSEGRLIGDWQSHWLKATLGLYEISGDAESATVTQQFIYERLRNAVDRHTDWYASGYDDEMKQRRERDQAYSPFVASSYEMSESDAFTAPCYTIPCNGDVPARHWKHYMFVFKIHKDNYYSTNDLARNRQIDFDRMWFDETTFGTTSLAKSERAWDRLGTALETELDSILYLHRICSSGELETPDNPCG